MLSEQESWTHFMEKVIPEESFKEGKKGLQANPGGVAEPEQRR